VEIPHFVRNDIGRNCAVEDGFDRTLINFVKNHRTMSTSEVLYTKDLRTEATHTLSGDKIITDAPPDNKGRGEAFSPTDMLATSLATCMMTIMGIAANEHGFSVDGMTASVKKVMYSDPRRVGEIHVALSFPASSYSDKEKKFIEKAAFTCPVSQSLHPDLKQEISFLFL